MRCVIAGQMVSGCMVSGGIVPPDPTLQIPSLLIPYPLDMLPPPNTLPPADTLPSWIPYPLNTLPPGRDMGPDIPYPSQKDMGPGIRKGTGTSDTLPPCEQTHACKNMTFLQFRWRAVKIVNSSFGILQEGHTLLTDP